VEIVLQAGPHKYDVVYRDIHPGFCGFKFSRALKIVLATQKNRVALYEGQLKKLKKTDYAAIA
jgi:hypothetical protein